MAKFNSRSAGTKTVNKAGGVGFTETPELELALTALTTFVEGKFYESKDGLIDRLVRLCEQVSPEYLSNLAVYARKEANMRSVSHVLIAELARLHKGKKKEILAGIQRLDDMAEILAYYGFRYGKPIPNSIKKAFALKLQKADSYQLGKYKMEGKDVKLVDLFNLCHPKPINEEQNIMWAKLLKGELESPETWEVLISTAKGKEEAKARWERLVIEDRLGYMALLRNLRNLDKYGVSMEVQKIAAEKIKNPDEVKKSKQLPFRFLSAYETAPNTLFKDAISFALDEAVANMPKFDGKTAVFVDVSGSMTSAVSGKSQMSCAKIGLLFGLALWKANPTDSQFFTFDTQLYGFNLSSRTPLIDMIQGIPVNGGGTSTHMTFDYLRQEKILVDQVFILSDNMGYDGGVNRSFEAYRREVNPNVKLFAIDLVGYGTLQFPQNNAFHVGGWSEKIFDVVKLLLQDKNALVNTINNYEISKSEMAPN